MPSKLARAFNDPELSDVTVIIVANQSVAPSTEQRTESRGELIKRTIHGHKLVLSCSSEYFRALIARWQRNKEPALTGDDGHSGGKAGKGKKRTHEEVEDEPPKVVLNVAAELVPLAEDMVKYMYLEELEQHSILDLLQLMQLADEYGVVPLISECVKKGRDVGFEEWPMEAKLAAVQLPEPLLGNQDVKELVTALKQHLWTTFSALRTAAEEMDDDSSSSSSAAASALVSHLLGDYLDLEAAWNQKERQEKVLGWSYDAVEALLGRNDLKVASENIVLVVALSWLRHQGSAVMQERGHQLLQKVRFPQLRPCMNALVARACFNGPQDIQELLQSVRVMEHVSYYLTANEAARKHLEKGAFCEDWGESRQEAPAEGTFQFKIQVSDIERQAKALADDSTVGSSEQEMLPMSTITDGITCTPSFYLDRDSSNPATASLVVGLHCEVVVQGAQLAFRWNGLPKWLDFSWSTALEFNGTTIVHDYVFSGLFSTAGDDVLRGIHLHSPMTSLEQHVQDGAIGPFKLTYKML